MGDEYEGQGGSYIIGEDGKRVLIERTTDAIVEPETKPVYTKSKKMVKAGGVDNAEAQ